MNLAILLTSSAALLAAFIGAAQYYSECVKSYLMQADFKELFLLKFVCASKEVIGFDLPDTDWCCNHKPSVGQINTAIYFLTEENLIKTTKIRTAFKGKTGLNCILRPTYLGRLAAKRWLTTALVASLEREQRALAKPQQDATL